ncbi:unnamed protein product [Echinostoma caproni]|uniref:Transposase n=1 Tax=Echinostoma caproni TaxID=27848 RepID=A0A183APP0_9TREM|nr:unnamed protein product [Echinostoma caproni]
MNYDSRPNNPIEDDLERLHNHEFEDMADDRVSISREGCAALAIVTERTRHNGIQFEVPLPWQTGSHRLPDNREVALHRLSYLKELLRRDTELQEAYYNAMKRNLELGYMRHIVREADNEEPPWYLPHYPVMNPKKPQRTRVGFDCAAICTGVALED